MGNNSGTGAPGPDTPVERQPEPDRVRLALDQLSALGQTRRELEALIRLMTKYSLARRAAAEESKLPSNTTVDELLKWTFDQLRLKEDEASMDVIVGAIVAQLRAFARAQVQTEATEGEKWGVGKL